MVRTEVEMVGWRCLLAKGRFGNSIPGFSYLPLHLHQVRLTHQSHRIRLDRARLVEKALLLREQTLIWILHRSKGSGHQQLLAHLIRLVISLRIFRRRRRSTL